MLKIGEFSKLTNISVRMLHYYDKMDLLKPQEIDEMNGYRYYSVKQVPTLQKIIMLRDLHFQISEIKEALEHWSNEYLIEQLDKKIKQKQEIILTEKKQIKQIESAIESIHSHQLEMQSAVIIREVPSLRVISLRKTISHYADEGKLWAELSQYVKKNHIEISKQNNNNIALYHDIEYKEHDVDVEVCFIVKKMKKAETPFEYRIIDECKMMACMNVQGHYHHLNQAYQSLMLWLDHHPDYEINGMNRQICHRDHTNEEKEGDYLTEIQIPIRLRSGE